MLTKLNLKSAKNIAEKVAKLPLSDGRGRGCSPAGVTTTGEGRTKSAFTLAEVLITLGVIGVVAAVTLPTLLTNVQDRVRQEQVRTVKYKFTKATEKMNSLGLIGHYDSTMDFVNELKKHMSIAKICESSKLNECWPSGSITVPTNKDGATSQTNVNTILTGTQLKALALGTKNTETVGIVTGDGVPMILVYSPNCSGFDEAKQYTWSVENGKPVTNATTNCVSAIFDINGQKGPNKIGTDVRTLNSIFGSVDLGYGIVAADNAICKNMKKKYGFKYCENSQDYWVGAIYACDKIGLHLPSMQTLANMANARYGITQIGPYTVYMGPDYKTENGDCIDWLKTNPDYGPSKLWFSESDAIICANSIVDSPTSSVGTSIEGYYWSNAEVSAVVAYRRFITSSWSNWNKYSRNQSTHKALCVGD